MSHCPQLVFDLDDGTVRAYRGDAPLPSGALKPPAYVTRTGARAKDALDADFALLVVGCTGATAPVPPPTKALDQSLLRTNVQKAIRRQLPGAAARSVMQYLSQPSAGKTSLSNADIKTLLQRLPVDAAEDATTVPRLGAAIFLALGATSQLGITAQSPAAARHVACCAAELAAAPRDPSFETAPKWNQGRGANPTSPDLDEATKLILVRSPLQVIEAAGDRADHAALVLLLHVAAETAFKEKSKLRSLWAAAATRLGRGEPPCPAFQLPPLPSFELSGDGTLLPPAERLFYSADFHNKDRWAELRRRLRARGVQTDEKSLKSAVAREAYLNVRDAPAVHCLISGCQKPPPLPKEWETRLCEVEWPAVAAQLWEPREIVASARAAGETDLETDPSASSSDPGGPKAKKQKKAA